MTATDGDARCHNPVVALPAAGSTLSLDRVRDGMEVGRLATQGNLVPCALARTSLLWYCATGAHQPWSGWAPPIRARIQGSKANWWRSN